jgi:hypothetical protein
MCKKIRRGSRLSHYRPASKNNDDSTMTHNPERICEPVHIPNNFTGSANVPHGRNVESRLLVGSLGLFREPATN